MNTKMEEIVAVRAAMQNPIYGKLVDFNLRGEHIDLIIRCEAKDVSLPEREIYPKIDEQIDSRRK